MYHDTASQVEETILHGRENNTILFYEIHATTAPSFFRLRKRLRRWRETAAQNQVPVFFFSLVREPVSYSFSHFNFFHLQKRNPSFERCNATEHDFIRKSVFNPQCQFLYKGEPSMRVQKNKNLQKNNITVQEQNCDMIQKEIIEQMDWVGTTAKLTKETLPLLSKLLDLPTSFTFENFRVSKNLPEHLPFGQENVSLLAIQNIREMSVFDTSLYTAIKNHYRYIDIIA